MTIDEAIKHCEEVAEAKEKEGSLNQESFMPLDDFMKYRVDCLECAKEHRQLAEWLKELQKWRVIKEGIYSLCDNDCEYPQYKEKGTMCDACMIGQVIDHLERVFGEG